MYFNGAINDFRPVSLCLHLLSGQTALKRAGFRAISALTLLSAQAVLKRFGARRFDFC